MIGKNTIVINQAEAIRAIQFYLNQVQFKETVIVKSVSYNASSYTFDVIIEDSDQKEAATEKH